MSYGGRVIVAGLAALAWILMASPAAAAAGAGKPFSDNFTKDTAINPGWTLAEPNAASYATIGHKGLLLDASGQNGGADLWPSTNYDASLLLQPIDPAKDWMITTSIIFSITNNYMGAGLVLTQQTSGFTPASLFHRFEYGDNPQPGLEGFTNGTPDPVYVAFTGGKVVLRVQKSGSTYTYAYAVKGHGFTVISTLTDTASYSYVGLISVRQPYDGQTGVDSKPLFRDFKIKLMKP